MRRTRRDATRLALLVALGAALPAPSAIAQDDPATHPLCVFSVDEMTGLTGVPIVERAAAGLECAYSADPAERPVQVLLAILPPDPTALEPTEDGLSQPRLDHPDGQDATIAGLPAWAAAEATWVDLGDDVFQVWVNALFDADPPAMPATALAIAEAAVPRYLAAPRPSPTPPPSDGLATRFPAEVDGEALEPRLSGGQELFAQLEAFAFTPATQEGVAALRAAIEATGVTLDQVEGGEGLLLDFEAGTSLSITAIRVPGQDTAALVEAAIAAFVDFAGGTPEPLSIAGRDVIRVAEPPGGLDGERWFVADGDVLWVLDGDRVMVEALLAALPTSEGGG